MGLNYSIAMLKNPQNQDESAKAYAKSQITRELSLKELSRRVAAQTTASRADVTAVIIATVENMIDGLHAGEQVDFGDLGKFRLQITSRGAETAEKFTAANITGVNIQFIPGEDLKIYSPVLSFHPYLPVLPHVCCSKLKRQDRRQWTFQKRLLPVEIPAVNRMTVATPVAEDWMKTRWDRI